MVKFKKYFAHESIELLEYLINTDEEKISKLVGLIQNRLNKLVKKYLTVSEDEEKNKKLGSMIYIAEKIIDFNE